MNIGDVVQLKSGGPLMTMIRRHEKTDVANKVSEVVCGWFNTDGQNYEYKTQIFPLETLRNQTETIRSEPEGTGTTWKPIP